MSGPTGVSMVTYFPSYILPLELRAISTTLSPLPAPKLRAFTTSVYFVLGFTPNGFACRTW